MLFLFNRYAILALSLGSVAQVVPWGWQPQIDHSRIEVSLAPSLCKLILTILIQTYAVASSFNTHLVLTPSKLYRPCAISRCLSGPGQHYVCRFVSILLL